MQGNVFPDQADRDRMQRMMQVIDHLLPGIQIRLGTRQVQAFQNSVNIAMCNRVGREDKMIFSGESVVCNYDGDIISAAGSDEILLISEVDLSDASEKRKKKPYTSLRRPDLYE